MRIWSVIPASLSTSTKHYGVAVSTYTSYSDRTYLRIYVGDWLLE